MVSATASANIALVKYWGKRDTELNIPAAGSLSVTLDTLRTWTTVALIEGASGDTLTMDGVAQTGRPLARVSAFLDLVRVQTGQKRYAAVQSKNAFPTAAGLASSASGFAALAIAANEAYQTHLSDQALSILARRGSGSAARSVFGGFVRMNAGEKADGSDAYAERLAGIDLDLVAVIFVAQRGEKEVGSTEGMEQTRATSPYYQPWIEHVPKDLVDAEKALRSQDFDRIAEVVEGNCLAMHASAMAARPGIIYFSPSTLWAIESVRTLRASGVPTFFTIDAGPHVVAFTKPDYVDRVRETFQGHDNVAQVLVSGIGGDACPIDEVP